MKTTQAQGTPTRTTSKINLELEGIPRETKSKIKQDVGEFLVEQILHSVASEQSPVEGESWPKLDKDYKKLKISEGLSGKADLESSGSLLDALTFKATEEGVEIGFFNKQAWKADGHLKFSGEENNIPQRRFLPAEGQTFKKDILQEAENIIDDARVESTDFPKSELKEIETKSELYQYFKDKFGDLGNAEIRHLILRNNSLTSALDDLGLMDLI